MQLPVAGCHRYASVVCFEEEVRTAATRFRRALEGGGLLAIGFDAFPAGACGDASELLGQYLTDCGLGNWRYVRGSKSDSLWTHGWIEQDGLLVDITADQFAEVGDPVIVTYESDWHKGWAGRRAHVASLDIFDPEYGWEYRADYAVLKTRADALRGR